MSADGGSNQKAASAPIERKRTNPAARWQPVFIFGIGAVLTYLVGQQPKAPPQIQYVVLAVTWLVSNQVSGEAVVKLLMPISEAFAQRIRPSNQLSLPETESRTETVE